MALSVGYALGQQLGGAVAVEEKSEQVGGGWLIDIFFGLGIGVVWWLVSVCEHAPSSWYEGRLGTGQRRNADTRCEQVGGGLPRLSCRRYRSRHQRKISHALTRSSVGGGMASTLPRRISRYHFFSAEQPMTIPARPIPPSTFETTSLLSHCSLHVRSAAH